MSDYPSLMLDLETFGTKPGSAIVAIGAVEFGKAGIGRKFYTRVDWQSNIDAGLEIDLETIRWWMRQSDEARNEITGDGQPLERVLADFAEWLSPDTKEVWGNGADFDPPILAAAYEAVGQPVPWPKFAARCFRTFKHTVLKDDLLLRETDLHHALEDAVYQAWNVIKAISRKEDESC